MIAVRHYVSPQDYLDLERCSHIRHEYRRGLVYAMAGGTDNPDRIALNLLSRINRHLGDSACRFHSSNVKVNSPSTQALDEGEKFHDYQRLESNALDEAGDRLFLQSIDLEFAIADLDRGLDP